MTHNEQNVDVHHEGDAHDLNVTVTESDGTPVDLTGASVEWLLKENVRDDDSAAVITKSGDEGTTPSDITFTDVSNGNLTIHINTDETTGLVDWTSVTSNTQSFHHRIRVTDAAGNRFTGFTGEFVIHI